MKRTQFAMRLPDASTATVDVDHLSGRASLYWDDRHVQTSDMRSGSRSDRTASRSPRAGTACGGST
jgi:hypothetical protein